MIEFVNLGLAFGNRILLHDISMKIKKGCVTGILGPNGCGKSTLLNCIQRVTPYSGTILLNGRDIQTFRDNEIAKVLAVVPQLHKPSFPYSALDIVLTGRAAYVSYLPLQKDIEIAMASMETVGIAHLADKPYTQLSGGERQLVMIARALCQEPQIVLLDEPTSFLDIKNQHRIMDMVRGLSCKKRVTCLVTLHDPNLALSYCDDVLLF